MSEREEETDENDSVDVQHRLRHDACLTMASTHEVRGGRRGNANNELGYLRAGNEAFNQHLQWKLDLQGGQCVVGVHYGVDTGIKHGKDHSTRCILSDTDRPHNKNHTRVMISL